MCKWIICVISVLCMKPPNNLWFLDISLLTIETRKCRIKLLSLGKKKSWIHCHCVLSFLNESFRQPTDTSLGFYFFKNSMCTTLPKLWGEIIKEFWDSPPLPFLKPIQESPCRINQVLTPDPRASFMDGCVTYAVTQRCRYLEEPCI